MILWLYTAYNKHDVDKKLATKPEKNLKYYRMSSHNFAAVCTHGWIVKAHSLDFINNRILAKI